MSGERNLNQLLKTISAKLVDGIYVFVTVAEDQVPNDVAPRMGISGK